MKNPSNEQPYFSIISPVYGASGIVIKLVTEIENELKKFNKSYEIILVEDGSPDNSWLEIEEICKSNLNVKGIKLSRNFGQHYAITAGLDHANGEWVIVMDCDLQDNPEEIYKLYEMASKMGYDIVLARRVDKQHNFLVRLTSSLFYRVLSYLTGAKQDSSIANFGIYRKNVIEAIKAMREPIRYFPSMVKWVGFTQGFCEVDHRPRETGKSSYDFNKRLRLAINIMLAYSNKPLILTVKLGILLAVSSFFVALVILSLALLGLITVSGYASIMISLWFLAGLIIFIMGILGLYLSRVFDGIKNRPLYLIKELKNID